MPVMIMLLQKLPIMLIPVQEFRLLTEVSTCNSAVLFSLGLCFWRSLVSSVYEFLKPPRKPANLRKLGSQFCLRSLAP